MDGNSPRKRGLSSLCARRSGLARNHLTFRAFKASRGPFDRYIRRKDAVRKLPMGSPDLNGQSVVQFLPDGLSVRGHG